MITPEKIRLNLAARKESDVQCAAQLILFEIEKELMRGERRIALTKLVAGTYALYNIFWDNIDSIVKIVIEDSLNSGWNVEVIRYTRGFWLFKRYQIILVFTERA